MNPSSQFLLSVSCMTKWSAPPIDIPRCLPLRFLLQGPVGSRHQGGGVRGGTPFAPSATDPMTPLTIQRPMRRPLMQSQWAVSHFITCHGDESPGNHRDAHFALMKCCHLVDSQAVCLHKIPDILQLYLFILFILIAQALPCYFFPSSPTAIFQICCFC